MPKTLINKDHQFRSECSISRTLELVGDKWTLLIVRDLLWHEKHTYRELHESVKKIPTNILSDRLRRLERWKLVEREAYQERPVRYIYRLTEAGLAFEPVLVQVMSWGHQYLGGGLYRYKMCKG